MALQSNKHYFDTSVQNEEVLEERYMTLNKDEKLDKYVSRTETIKNTLKQIKEQGNAPDDLYQKLLKLMSSGLGSKSELTCFLNACDCTLGTIKNDINTFKDVVSRYLNNRDLTDAVPKEWIQALIDTGSSRKLGKVGEKKLVELAEKESFTIVSTMEDLKNADKAVAQFTKAEFSISKIKTYLGIDLNFGGPDKMLDVILKSGNKYVFIEAKHLKEGGGSQDKQIKELIEIISKTNDNKNVYLGAFVDGVYSNVLLDGIDDTLFKNPDKLKEEENKSEKLKQQRYDIVKGLSTNKRSFWFNTAGFKEFLKDF